jgi:hypothetical protein
VAPNRRTVSWGRQEPEELRTAVTDWREVRDCGGRGTGAPRCGGTPDAAAIPVRRVLALDLGVFHRTAHAVTFRESLVWSVVWVALALAFNYAFYLYATGRFGAETGTRVTLEFLTGYIVEKSLAVDNVLVFVLVFDSFVVMGLVEPPILFPCGRGQDWLHVPQSAIS